MSSILEALKKAEAESPSQDPVQVRAGKLTLGVQRTPRRRRRLRWVAIAGLLLAAAGALWFFSPHRQVQTTANVQSYRITAPAEPPTASTRASGARTTGREPVQRTAAPVARPVKSAPAPAARPSAGSGAARPAATQSHRHPPVPQNRIQVRPAPAPAPLRRPAAGTTPRTTGTAKATRRTPAGPVYERSSPGLTLQAIAWDPDARKRFAVVNNQIVREGQSVDGKVVERIAEDGIIVARAGRRWKIEFRID